MSQVYWAADSGGDFATGSKWDGGTVPGPKYPPCQISRTLAELA